MNYLAHLFLSGHDSEIMIGNILEDFVVGNIDNPRNEYIPQRIKLGVLLHRQIDTLTDTHENVKKCKLKFRADFGKYSPIITDVLFDHYLIKQWSKFTNESFEDFKKRAYKSLKTNLESQPQQMIDIVDSMIKHDWLGNYIHEWGLIKAFEGLNKKINKPGIDLTNSITIFNENYKYIEENFMVFFKDLKQHCDLFIEQNSINGK